MHCNFCIKNTFIPCRSSRNLRCFCSTIVTFRQLRLLMCLWRPNSAVGKFFIHDFCYLLVTQVLTNHRNVFNVTIRCTSPRRRKSCAISTAFLIHILVLRLVRKIFIYLRNETKSMGQ